VTDSTPFDPSAALRQGSASLAHSVEAGATMMSESSIDATLLLHSIGFEPVDFVFGVAAQSFPFRVWNSGSTPGFRQFPQGPVPRATATFDAAFTRAKEKVRQRAASLGASGVVDTTLSVVVRERYLLVQVSGTAIRRRGAVAKSEAAHPPFVSDVSARSLVGLVQMGFLPSDYVAGYGFSAVTFVNPPNFNRNAEITTLTQAMYESREAAMEKLQRAAQAKDVVGVVGIRTLEQRHLQLDIRVVMFGATGTSIVRYGVNVEPTPRLTLSLDESKLSFDPIVSHPTEADVPDAAPHRAIIEQAVPKGARLLARMTLLANLWA
jgi:uncharacterized protein YbjQ (UPF0145 family)